MTGFFVTAGNFGAGPPNLDPYADPFTVHVGNAFSDSNKTWSIERVRSFTTSNPQFQVQLKTGATYYAAFALWNGRLGESSHIKSVSQWYSITISDTPPPYLSSPLTSQAPVISPTLAGAVGLGLLIIGIIIGVVVRSKNKG